MAARTKLTRGQVRTFARLMGDPRVKTIDVIHSHERDSAIEYQVTFDDGTFGAHVILNIDGDVVQR